MRSSILLLLLLPQIIQADEPKKSLSPAETRKAFLKMLHRPNVPLDVKEESSKEADGSITEQLSFASEKKANGTVERVPVMIVRPAKSGKYPAMIVLHGTGGNKEGVKPWLVDFANRDIIGVAIDARYHGERVPGAKGADAYNEAITRAWRTVRANRWSTRFITTPVGICGGRSIISRRGPTSIRSDWA